MRRGILVFLAGLVPFAAFAEPPRVVADIPPVHALVARVMAGIAEPALILPPGTSPHAHALRPSQAAALERAVIVFWVGPELTPWLERPLETLAPDAASVPLLEADGARLLPYRWGDTAGHGTEGHDDHAEDDHADHDHGDHVHAAGATDPHAWFDPVNADAWLAEIAARLTEADPGNAATYASNARAAQAELADLRAALTDRLAPLRETQLIVYHDALQYFEARFGLTVVGAMTRGESAPRPRHLAKLREVAGTGDVCIVLEPQADPGLGAAVSGPDGDRVVTLDPQGRGIAPGVGFYTALLTALADSLTECL